jgi:hypothetical protein
MEAQMIQLSTVEMRRAGAPMRRRPTDFRDQFIRLGWATVDHYSTSWKVVARWLKEEGRDILTAERAAAVIQQRQNRQGEIGRAFRADSSPAAEPDKIRMADNPHQPQNEGQQA